MKVATGALMFVGFIVLMAGIGSKILGISLFAPFFSSAGSYFIAANSCLLLALVVDKFNKD